MQGGVCWGREQVTQQVANSRDALPQGSASDYLRQIGFREYARYVSFHFPFTHERSLLEHLRAVPWRYDQRLFKVRAAHGQPKNSVGCSWGEAFDQQVSRLTGVRHCHI